MKVLMNVKINNNIFQQQIDEKQKQYQESQQSYFSTRKTIQHQQIRNNQQTQLADHKRSGLQIQFNVHDSNQTSLYLSHNPVIICIYEENLQYCHMILDLIDQYLREQKDNQFYIKAFKKNDKTTSLEIQLDKGLITFHIKCCPRDKDYDLMISSIFQIYTELNSDLKQLCGYLSFWAYRRRILDDNILPEQAIYCMAIEFCLINDLVPNIFQDQYCLWGKDKLKLKQQIEEKRQPPDLKLLNQYFDSDEYIIYRKITMKKNEKKAQLERLVHFLSYPRFKDLEEIKRIWKQHRMKTSKKDMIQQQNLGVLVAKFFHSYACGKKSQRAISIDQKTIIPYDREIGFVVMNPILSENILTPQLIKRQRNENFISNNKYLEVKQEFERAYDLIIDGKFKELCEFKQTFT